MTDIEHHRPPPPLTVFETATGADWKKAIRSLVDGFAPDNPTHYSGFVIVSQSWHKHLREAVQMIRNITGIQFICGACAEGLMGRTDAYIDSPAVTIALFPAGDNAFRLFRLVTQPETKYMLISKNPKPFTPAVSVLFVDDRLPQGIERADRWIANRDAFFQCGAMLHAGDKGVFFDGEEHRNGATGLVLDPNFVELITEQASPAVTISPRFTVTSAEGNRIFTLDHHTAAKVMQDAVNTYLSDGERELVALIGFPHARDPRRMQVVPVTGIDATEGAISLVQSVSVGDQVCICVRDMEGTSREVANATDSLVTRMADKEVYGVLGFFSRSRHSGALARDPTYDLRCVQDVLPEDVPFCGVVVSSNFVEREPLGQDVLLIGFAKAESSDLPVYF